jgi:hypothetical protein
MRNPNSPHLFDFTEGAAVALTGGFEGVFVTGAARLTGDLVGDLVATASALNRHASILQRVSETTPTSAEPNGKGIFHTAGRAVSY